MGSAALYHLAKRGLNALGIDQFQIPHNLGSSHGLTRIIRLAYYEDLSYVPLLRRAYELWAELEAAYGEQLFFQTGSIDMGPEDSDVFRGSLLSCIEHGFEHDVLNNVELRVRFPGYRMPAETMAVYQPQGGLLTPERCISAFSQLAQSHGAAIHCGERVLGWDILADERLAVRTDAARYVAEKLVICGGAWAYKLAPNLADAAVPERQALIWLEPKRADWFQLDRFPVWNGQLEEGRYYGLPEFNPSGSTPGMKLGRYHHLDETCDPDTVDREANATDEAILRQFAERYFPDGAGRTHRYGRLHVHQYAGRAFSAGYPAASAAGFGRRRLQRARLQNGQRHRRGDGGPGAKPARRAMISPCTAFRVSKRKTHDRCRGDLSGRLPTAQRV